MSRREAIQQVRDLAVRCELAQRSALRHEAEGSTARARMSRAAAARHAEQALAIARGV